MATLLEYLTGFGLASGAGGKACIPLLALGLFHHTPYFKLSAQFVWLSHPPVLVGLALLALVELWADAHPDLGQWSDLAAYLPKVVAGFIACAAATGKVDPSLVKLLASGVLGSVTATSVHWLRNRIRRPVRDIGGDIHDSLGKITTAGEAGASTAISATAILLPLLSLLVLALGITAGFLVIKLLKVRRGRCRQCGQPIMKGALVCPHCRASQE